MLGLQGNWISNNIIICTVIYQHLCVFLSHIEEISMEVNAVLPLGGVLPETLGGFILTLTLFTTKICDFSFPIYHLTKKFDSLFMTVATGTVSLSTIYEGLLLIACFIDKDEKVAYPRLEGKNHTLVMTKTAERPYPFGAAYTYIAPIRKRPPGVLHFKYFVCRFVNKTVKCLAYV